MITTHGKISLQTLLKVCLLSYITIAGRYLCFNIHAGLCDNLFVSLKEDFGQYFVSQTLGYVTAAKYGLSEVELLDILASDGEVGTNCVIKKKMIVG